MVEVPQPTLKKLPVPSLAKSIVLIWTLMVGSFLPASTMFYEPDRHGLYGGAQGTGGIEAVVNVGTSTTGIMSDFFGHAVASGTGTTTNWNAVRSLGYGVQPGDTAQILDGTHDVSTALAWRGKYIDPTGIYYLGSRYYDPASGTFLSADPLGHAASMDLYSDCGGDPINGFDPDGRIQSNYSAGWNEKMGSSTTNPNAWWSQAASTLGSTQGGGYQGATISGFLQREYGFVVKGPKDLAEGVGYSAIAPFSNAFQAVEDNYDMFTYPGGIQAWGEMHQQQQMQGWVNAWNGFVSEANDPTGQGELALDISTTIMTGRAGFGGGTGVRLPPLPEAVENPLLLMAPETARLPQDIAVNQNAPALKPWQNRIIGLSAVQRQALAADIQGAIAQGATDIRVNQQQVNAAMQRVGVNQPDLQYTLPNYTRVYIEYDTTTPSSWPNTPSGPSHAARILANDPNGVVILRTY